MWRTEAGQLCGETEGENTQGLGEDGFGVSFSVVFIFGVSSLHLFAFILWSLLPNYHKKPGYPLQIIS